MQEENHASCAEELLRLRQEISLLRDAQARRDQAIAELCESERRYRHLIDHANDIIYRADAGGHFTYFNPTATRLLGYSADEILGRLYLDLIHPDYRKEAKRFYVRQLRMQILNTYYEYPAIAKDGRILWLGQNVQLVTEGESICGIQAIARDITERRLAEERLQKAYAELERRVEERTAELNALNLSLIRAQEALLHSEKLRALGELASGVAHNVNNMLAAVLGYAELIQSSDQAGAEVKQFARTIERAAMDGAEIVRRMQRFSRMETEQNAALFDLAGVAQEAIDLTRPAWHNEATGRGVKIDIEADLQPGLWVMGTASEIREVLVNLVKNAVDAMWQGGTLTLRGFRANDSVLLEVGDTGVGMDETTRQRLFEPFYTTKEMGKGVGLGLSVAWGIVTRHQGAISVESAPGEGALFRLCFPLANRAAISREAEVGGASVDGISILLVEDEELILALLARILVRHGAKIAIASNAEEARKWLADHAAACDMVISDHGMSGATGIELLAWIRNRYPNIRRVLLSGWGGDLPGHADSSSAELILSKPIQHNKLLAALSKLLAKARMKDEG